MHLYVRQQKRHRCILSVFKRMFLLPEWWKQLPDAALQKQNNNENCHPSKTRYSYFHPEQGSHCDSLQWPHPQIVQEHHYLKRERQSLLGKKNKTISTHCRKNLLWRNRQEPKQHWSQWVLNLLKQKSKCTCQMTLFQGSTGSDTGTSREDSTSSTEGRCWFCLHHRWA